MSQPGNTPPNGVPCGCPRARDGGQGPRACTLVECPSHLRMPGARGPTGKRLRLALFVEDTCARDVGQRAKSHGITLTYRELGVLLGASRQAVHHSAKTGWLKVKKALNLKR